MLPDRGLSQYTSLSGTGETTIVTADPTFTNGLTGLIITTINAAAGTLTLREATGGGTKAVFNLPNAATAPGPFVVTFDPPLSQSAKNNNWTLQASVNASTYNVTAMFVKQ
jgi:hypothetical protein